MREADYHGYSVQELKGFLKAIGVACPSKAKKAELITLLEVKNE